MCVVGVKLHSRPNVTKRNLWNFIGSMKMIYLVEVRSFISSDRETNVEDGNSELNIVYTVYKIFVVNK